MRGAGSAASPAGSGPSGARNTAWACSGQGTQVGAGQWVPEHPAAIAARRASPLACHQQAQPQAGSPAHRHHDSQRLHLQQASSAAGRRRLHRVQRADLGAGGALEGARGGGLEGRAGGHAHAVAGQQCAGRHPQRGQSLVHALLPLGGQLGGAQPQALAGRQQARLAERGDGRLPQALWRGAGGERMDELHLRRQAWSSPWQPWTRPPGCAARTWVGQQRRGHLCVRAAGQVDHRGLQQQGSWGRLLGEQGSVLGLEPGRSNRLQRAALLGRLHGRSVSAERHGER